MGVYDRQRATALRLIAAKGQEVIWQQQTATGGTPAKPAATATVEHLVRIVFLPVEREYVGTFLQLIRDTDIPEGYMLGMMGFVPFTPSLKDTVLRGAETLHLSQRNGVEVINPNGEGAVLYMLRFVR